MNYFTYIKFLNQMIKEHKKNLIMLIFLMIVLVIFESFSFSLILPIVESLLPTERNVVFFESIFKNFNFLNIEYKFIFFASIFFIIYLSKIIFNIFFSWYQNNFFCKILTYLSDQLYKKYINQNIIFHKNADISILLRNLNSELSIFLREGMASAPPTSFKINNEQFLSVVVTGGGQRSSQKLKKIITFSLKN